MGELWFLLGLYRISVPVPAAAEIRRFSQIRLKSDSGQNFVPISGFSKILKSAV